MTRNKGNTSYYLLPFSRNNKYHSISIQQRSVYRGNFGKLLRSYLILLHESKKRIISIKPNPSSSPNTEWPSTFTITLVESDPRVESRFLHHRRPSTTHRATDLHRASRHCFPRSIDQADTPWKKTLASRKERECIREREIRVETTRIYEPVVNGAHQLCGNP